MENQAKKLVELSGLTNPVLKDATVKYIVKDKLIKRPINKLVSLLAHPCSQEQIGKINVTFEQKYSNLDDSDIDPGSGKPLKAVVIDMVAHNASRIIGEGFDIAFKDNLEINSQTGQVVVKRDSSGKPDDRFTACAKAEILETPKLSESDPYKGSQQGLGRSRRHKRSQRKTRKHKKSKSTKI